jgi:hypothetical protein
MTAKTNVVKEMENILSLDPFKTDFKIIKIKIKLLNQKDRQRLLLICKNIFETIDLRQNSLNRISACKVAIALVPDSISLIKQYLGIKIGKSIFELHFSLFCFLDQIIAMENMEAFKITMLSIIEQYLIDIKEDYAHAAFMAGDLLGQHWDVKESTGTLIDISIKAKYVAGRTSAIHALSHILHRVPNSSPEKERIVPLIESISRNDRSKHVRQIAKMILDGKEY